LRARSRSATARGAGDRAQRADRRQRQLRLDHPEFGDRVTTQIVIELDRRVVRPSTLRFTDGLAPLTQLGAPLTSRLIRGELELVKITVPVACLSGPCVARSGVHADRSAARPGERVEARRAARACLRRVASLRVRGA